jgi:hypothetical protein
MKVIRDEKIAKFTLRIADTGSGFIGVVNAGGKQLSRVEGDDPAVIWKQLHAAVGKASSSYFGYDGARARFLQFFPGGFHSTAFEGDERGSHGERNYKLKAKHKLDEAAPVEKALTGTGYGEAVLSAFRATNLLSPFEKTRLQPMLRGPDADAFVQAAARFAMGEIKPALAMMERLLRPHDNAKWTVVTYLPFLWRPDQHMFLKPVVTQDYASRVGHPFQHDYSTALEAPVYESLLDMMAETAREMSDLAPRDNIDLQSLVWVVGDYTEGDEPETLKG